MATASPVPALRPILECITQIDAQTYVAYFGYQSDVGFIVEVPVGPRNRFVPLPENRGQPTRFLPGRSQAYPRPAFSVVFDGAPLVWALDGRTATASRSSRLCTLGGS